MSEGSELKLFKSTGSPGTRCDSSAQSPKSINLQRSEQNGRKVFSGIHVCGLLQVGQVISSFFTVISAILVPIRQPKIYIARILGRSFINARRIKPYTEKMSTDTDF